MLIAERRRSIVTQSKIENPKLSLPDPASRTANPRSFTVLGVRVDAVQIPDVIAQWEEWIPRRAPNTKPNTRPRGITSSC